MYHIVKVSIQRYIAIRYRALMLNEYINFKQQASIRQSMHAVHNFVFLGNLQMDLGN